jgi:hypothetical protein
MHIEFRVGAAAALPSIVITKGMKLAELKKSVEFD